MWFHLAGICGFSGLEYVAILSGSDQLFLPGFFNRLVPLVDQQFAVDILDVELNCVQAEEKFLSNLFISLPGVQKSQHFEFTVA